MSYYEAVTTVSLPAGEDLRGDLYELLKIEEDSGVAKVIKATAVTDSPIGILAEEPTADETTDGLSVAVALLQGIVMMKAGATITAGYIVVPDTTTGRVAGVANVGALAEDGMGLGIALVTAADGDIFPVLAMTIAAPHSA